MFVVLRQHCEQESSKRYPGIQVCNLARPADGPPALRNIEGLPDCPAAEHNVSVQMIPRRKIDYLVAFGALSLVTALYGGITSWYDVRTSEPLISLSTFVSVILVAMWVDADSRGRPHIYRPYEHGWLIYVYWIPYVPYYFWRTRGAKGVLEFAGLLCLLLSWWIVQWLIDIAR
ncbi:MAG: hypothetical protein DMF21_14380 [Verrucomicrobia bacterium]|nr:MAG: hypothetical protein DMF21_14380 [Verrucomicrobiota bacterium]